MKIPKVVLLALFMAGCESNSVNVSQINHFIDSLRAAYAPDKRTAVFDVSVREENGRIILAGEMDQPKAKQSLLDVIRNTTGLPIVDSVELLPSANLGTKIDGIVDISVANMRSTPHSSAEMVNQVLLGHSVKVLKKQGGRLLIKSEDNYLGWVDPISICRVDSAHMAEYDKTRKLLVTRTFGTIRSSVDNGSTVSDVVMADLLVPVAKEGDFYQVKLPDGRTGYVHQSDVEYADIYFAAHHPTAVGIEKIAKEFIGFPYLWGGTSVKGFDCSGFTKTVFRMNGIDLPRDASQQVFLGEDVDPGKNFGNLKPGDLLFFGEKAINGRPEKIVHVGIYLGNGQFIQSSGMVRISSFFKADSSIFDEYDLNRFVRAKRILKNN